MHLYPTVKVKGQSFNGVKEMTVPSQSMSLKEIIRRFVRRESLPISKEGFYSEQMGDLEKISNADITEQFERVEQLKQNIKTGQQRYEEKINSEKLASQKRETGETKTVEQKTTSAT